VYISGPRKEKLQAFLQVSKVTHRLVGL